jgi:hypothetical protein
MRVVAAALVVLAAVGSTLAANGSESPDSRTRGPVLHGDVDGDGRLDLTVVEQRAPRTCRFRLVVRTDDGYLTAPVRPEICQSKPSEVYSGPDPHVDVLADVDGRTGLEIVVQLGHGAHTEFADIWAVRNGRLRRFSGPEPQISYGGSVGTGSHVVDCARRPGVVLMSTLIYQTPSRIVRVWYRTSELRFQRIRTRSIPWRATKSPTYQEFSDPQPFPTCAKARAPR